MYEFEVNHGSQTKTNAVDIVKSFEPLEQKIEALSVLPWEEHCTECAMPMCYTTCKLYEPRKDGKCRRFTDGIVPFHGANNPQGFITKVSFKRWGQLMAYGNLHAIPNQRFKWVERAVFTFDKLVSSIPDQHIAIRGRRGFSSRMQRRLKQSIASSGVFAASNEALPAYLLIQVFNPNDFSVGLTLTLRSSDESAYDAGYQQLLSLAKGFNEFKISTEEISRRVNLQEKFGISLNPNVLDEKDEGLSLYFGMLTFAWEKIATAELPSNTDTSKTTHVKVIVWDLDNTLWDGVLLELGLGNIKLKPGIYDVIKELDKRGILNSVASKNNYDDAILALRQCGLDEYMLFPQIGWEQKGLYVREITKQFNVGQNTIAFIDDQPFERDEVLSLNPQVRVYDAVDYSNILSRPEFNPPLSLESHMRREFYRLDVQRKEAMSSFGGEYSSFLKDCRIKLNIYTPSVENIDRIMELVQRTNQLNFSGNRYTSEEILKILELNTYDAYCLDCEDKYGQYGTVGFAIVNKEKNQLVDLMFSCRVQSKRVEHAFLGFLLSYYKSIGVNEFSAIYIKTSRNMKAGAVFEDMKFIECASNREAVGESVFKFDFSSEILDDKIITVLWNGKIIQ